LQPTEQCHDIDNDSKHDRAANDDRQRVGGLFKARMQMPLTGKAAFAAISQADEREARAKAMEAMGFRRVSRNGQA